MGIKPGLTCIEVSRSHQLFLSCLKQLSIKTRSAVTSSGLVSNRIAVVATHCMVLQRQSKHVSKRGSKLYRALLDASKAFNKVLINVFFSQKLIKSNVPIPLVRILCNWFSELS